MEERPQGGSDMPKPRKMNPEQPDHGTLPPLRRVGDQPQRKPGSAPAKKRRSPRSQYASDTEEFPVPPTYENYPPEYDYDDLPEYDYDEPIRRPAQRRPASRRAQHSPPPPPARRARADYVEAARPRKKRRKRPGFLGRLIRRLLGVVVIIFVIYSAAALLLISRLEKASAGTRTNTSGSLDRTYVQSILLIGTDSRDLTQERGRSDSMILLTLNSRTREIGMNSFMRDAYVEIPGHGSNKLNAAYSLGGAELLMDTLELNYDVSVDDYLCVSFTGFAGMIDAFGGVEITLSDEEAQAVNVILQSEVNALMGDDPMADFLPGGGTYVLDGKQALSYSRIRYVGNADFERTSRQREVMTQLIGNAKSRAAAAIPELMQSALPHVATNMSTTEMYLLSLQVPFLMGYGLQQQQIPADGTWSGAMIDGQSVLQVDFQANTNLLRETAYAASRTAEEAQ